MRRITHPYSIFALASTCVLSVLAGFTNGLLGAGAGIFFMLISRILNRKKGDGKEMYTFSVMCVIPVSVVSLFTYPRELFPPEDLFMIVPLAIIGGFFGSVLKKKINVSHLGLAFAIITVYSGISMIVRAL